MSEKQLLQALELSMLTLHFLHQKYITDEWGYNHFAGETHRLMGEREWVRGERALTLIKSPEQTEKQKLLLELEYVAQGMSIHLGQSEMDPADSEAHTIAWSVLNTVSKELDNLYR